MFVRSTYIVIAVIVLTLSAGCAPSDPVLPSSTPVPPTATSAPPTSATLPPTNTTGPDDPALRDGTGAVSDVDGGTISINTVEQIVLLQTLDGHTGRVLDVAFSSDGTFVASSGRDKKIRLWDVGSGQEVHSFQIKSVDMADLDSSTQGNILASGEAIWDLASMQEIHVLERGSRFPAFVAFSPDGSVLALGLFEQQITTWDVTSGQPVYTFDKQEDNKTKRIEFSPNGALLAVSVNDGTVRLLDVASGKIANVLQYGAETDIHDIAFSPDGKFLATGGRLPAVILWDVDSGKVVKTFRLTDNAISMDFSPDGRILATAGGIGYQVQLWDVESGTRLHSLPHDDQIMSIAFSPDGKLLAVGCLDSNVYLWGIPIDTPPLHTPASTVSPQPTATLGSESTGSDPVCSPARGEGTVSPAVSIYSITFVVNGLEQVVRMGDTLSASPGDEVKVREIIICAETFSGNSGEVCADFAPVDQNGREIASEHQGTHMTGMTPGFMTISGPDHTWIVGENWWQIAAVVNHWPPEETDDLDCANGRCERDDRMMIELR